MNAVGLRTMAQGICRVVDVNLDKWREWFPHDRSAVEVARCDLLALKHFAEIGLAISADGLLPGQGPAVMESVLPLAEAVCLDPTFQVEARVGCKVYSGKSCRAIFLGSGGGLTAVDAGDLLKVLALAFLGLRKLQPARPLAELGGDGDGV